MSDADIKGIVSGGKGKMKPVKTVSGGSLDDIVAYVHGMK
jgi:hypothetical protein